jgi:DNA-binding IclR family transcriptional regulator
MNWVTGISITLPVAGDVVVPVALRWETRPMPRVPTGESVVARVVRVLEAFTPDEPSLSVTEIARRSGLHVATASRLVAELAAHGLLVRCDGEVRVGVRMWELAQRASPTLSLREAAMPFLEDLHAVIGHHVQLGVLDGDEVLFVERMSAPNAVVNYTRIAGRLAMHASSSGLVLLAHAPPEQQERVLAAPMKRLTRNTPTDPTQVREMLADIRRRGYALCPGFIHLDATGVAVPVRDVSGAVVAAIGAVVPNDGNAYVHVPALLAAARGIGRLLASQ